MESRKSLPHRKVLLRQRCDLVVDSPSRSLGVRELRSERVVLVAEPPKTRLLCFELATIHSKLTPQRTLDLALLHEALTEVTTALQSGGEFVAFIERHRQYRRLRVPSLTSAEGADTVSVRPPLTRPASLAGNRHTVECNETRRNVHPAGENMWKDSHCIGRGM
jgi:hypothetical protein